MKKVLLIMQSAIEKRNFINAMPPLGILYISSFLESRGISVDVIDYNITDRDFCVAKNYDLIGFSVNCGNITMTLQMAKSIKEKYDKEIIVGGPQVMSDPEFFLNKAYIDGAILGEGEYTLYEYIQNKRLVKGLYLKNGGKIMFGNERSYVTDLDSLPFPALNKVNLKKYDVPIKKREPTSSIITTRGCPFGCIFCFHSLGHSLRLRSVKNVVDEIEWQVNELGIKEICIQDDNISLDIKRAKEIFRNIAEKNLDVVFQLYNGIRVDRVDEELLNLMKKAKLWLMNVSPESGDPQTIKLIKKGFDKEITKRVIKISKGMGFFTYSNFMIGFPWETREHIKRTIDFAVELDTDMVQFARVIAFPNTELYSMYNLKYKIENDIGLFYNNPVFNISKLSESEINKLIRTAYRRCYLKPSKVLKILKTLGLRNTYSLIRYSVSTRSV